LYIPNGKYQLVIFCAFGDKTHPEAEKTIPFPVRNLPKASSKSTSNSEGRY